MTQYIKKIKIITTEGKQIEKELFEIIVKLWSIIDDIDTYGDMAKSDNKLYRSLVERKQKTRYETGITSDGYNLFYKGIKIDSDDKQETMKFNM